MSSLLHPVGPEPPEVYWRRRLLVGLAIVVALIIIVVMFWPGDDSGSNPVASGSPTNTPSVSPSPSGSPSGSPSTTGSPSASATTECADSDIQVTAETPKDSYAAGALVQLYMTIQNVSDHPCNRNVGPRVNFFKVTSGGQNVWNSDDCHPGGRDQTVAIPKGGAFKASVTWDQTLSAPNCPSGQGKAQPGSYSVTGNNINVQSKPVNFAIT